MEKEFVTYKQALALKELGFDEECFAWYDSLDKNLWLNTESKQTLLFHKSLSRFSGSILAPLKQQVFRWFREKYEYIPHIYIYDDVNKYDFDIYGGLSDKFDEYDLCNDLYGTYEEAESACIDKLIEIANSQKDIDVPLSKQQDNG